MKAIVALIVTVILLSLSSCKRHDVTHSIVQLKGALGSCTGFQITAPSGKDYLITAGHCSLLENEDHTITVETEDDATVQSRVIAASASSDLLLLEAVPGLEGLPVADVDFPGEAIKIIGHGFGLPIWEVDGKIIGELQMLEWSETVCSAGAMPGHSGSPVLDPSNHIVGVLSTSNGFISGFVSLGDLQEFLKGY